MLSLLLSLLVGSIQTTASEDDYRQVVTCVAVHVARTWADGSDNLGEGMQAEGFAAQIEPLEAYTLPVRSHVGLSSYDVQAAKDALFSPARTCRDGLIRLDSP